MKKRRWTHGQHRFLLRKWQEHNGDVQKIVSDFDYVWHEQGIARNYNSVQNRMNLLERNNIKTLDDYNAIYPEATHYNDALAPNLYPEKVEKTEKANDALPFNVPPVMFSGAVHHALGIEKGKHNMIVVGHDCKWTYILKILRLFGFRGVIIVNIGGCASGKISYPATPPKKRG